MSGRHNRLFVLLLLFCAGVAYGTVFGNLKGIVHDPDHRPISGAQVKLLARNSDWSQETTTDSDGEFQFTAVPIGEYRAIVSFEGFNSVEQQVVVVSGSSPILHYQMVLSGVTQSVEVSEAAEVVNTTSDTPITLVDRKQIERTPGADRTNSLAMITNYVPGAYVVHDQLHIRGGHQVTWSVDGIPVPNTNIASNVGPQFDPKDIDYIEAQRGSLSAESGDRTYSEINVVPRTGFERNREIELVTSYGNYNQTNDQLTFGSHTERFAYYGSVNGNRSDLGLETPTSDVLHDMASGLGGFGMLVYNLNEHNQLRLVSSLRRDQYQIPNNPDQQASGVMDVEKESDAFVNFSWVHTGGPGQMLTVSPFFHFNRANYVGGPNDPQLSPQDNHASRYAGMQVTYSAAWKKHNLRSGVYGFAQHDSTLFGLQSTDESILSIHQKENLSGNLEAFFLEDQYKPTSWLTLNGGVRLTHFSGLVSENAASPRLGASIRIPHWNWVVRGFYGRYYQAPPLSTISDSLLNYAQEQGIGFLPLHGERDEEHEFGLSIPLRGWVFDVASFHTHARNFFDHDELGNSNIFFPLTIEGANIRGWEMTMRSPEIIHRGQLHLAYSNQHAEGFGAVSGGMTDFSTPDGRFLLDHDQRHTLNVGFDMKLPWHSWTSGNVYYGSGFADSNGPGHLPGHTTVDLTLGKSLRDNLSVSVGALNIANRRYLLDNSPTFGGTHYADPRQVFVQVRYRFHY
ncbi:MAG: TonB-dependent receptor [Acidobacteriia bacterium]|nr:TonB-dependent receptor [Terriglobia bacterium]